MSEREAYGAAGGAAGAGAEGGRDAAGEPEPDGGLLELGPGLARIAATSAWRGGVWAADAYARAGSRLMRAAVSGESAAELLQETGTELRGYARRLLGVIDEATDERPAEEARPESSTEELRRRGEELLSRSADVAFEEDLHPAYVRILEDLAPDEVRILRLLYRDGARPAVDVRKGIPFVPVGSELIEQGLSMIGAEAGLRHVDRVRQYLNNLNRLGLVWFSRDPISDAGRYQVIEVQPEVVDALERGGRLGHTVRRSVHLTPFGSDFCEAALPPESLRRWGAREDEEGGADGGGGSAEGRSGSAPSTTGT
jgi:Abortive infection alpha